MYYTKGECKKMGNSETCNLSLCSENKEECIMALKAYDSCTQQDCLIPEMLSPVVSAEKCPCTILENPPFGQLILPSFPITPTIKCSSIRILEKSFTIKSIEILSVSPCNFPNTGYWIIKLKYKFAFKLQFFDDKGNIIKISCSKSNDPYAPEVIKDYIEASTSFEKQVKLYGAAKTNVTITSNIFKANTVFSQGSPFVEVSGNAFPLKIKTEIKCPSMEDPYNPPKIVIKIYIGLFTIIKLLRLVSLLVKSTGFCFSKVCDDIIPDLCYDFDNLKFPYNEFNP